MNTKVDPNKVDELSVEFNKLSRIIEDGEIGINKEISALIRETNYQYSESYVRSATRESESLLREIRLLAESINEELSNKSKVLKSAASRYKKDEEEAKKEAKKTNPFTLVRTIFKSIAAKWMKGAKKAYEAFSSVVDGLGLGFLLGKGTNKYHEPSINLPLDISPLESNLKKSSKKSAEVEKLQQRLKDLGYDIKVDGYFGDQTLAIVNEYKKKYGLANTCDYEGVVDNQTWLYLFSGLSGELKYDPKKYLENVRMAQIRLKDMGYDVEITGYFDDKTLKAVNEFKDNNKLGNIGDWEGVIGPQTWGVLFGVGAVGKITAKPAEKEIEDSLIENPLFETGEGTSLDVAKLVALEVITSFEGGRACGDNDGAGMSLGFLQWNFGTGNLQPMLLDMANGTTSPGSDSDFETIFDFIDPVTNKKGCDVLKDILVKPKADQLAWARSISTYNGKNLLKEPWQSAFDALLKNNKFIKIENNASLYYINNAETIMKDDLGLETVRGYTLAFDISVNNGSIKSDFKKLAIEAMSVKSNMLTNPNHPDHDITGLDPNSNEYKRRASNKKVVEDLLSHINGVTDELLKKCYYLAAAAALQKTKGFSFDSWSRKVAIIEGHGIVHQGETKILLSKVTDAPVSNNPPPVSKNPKPSSVPVDTNSNSLLYSESYNVNQVEYTIEQQLLKENKYTRRERRVDSDNPLESIKAVVVHWVGNANSTAQANRNYFNNQTVYASSHYVVGLEGEVIQCVPDEQCAFHSGGKNYTQLAKTQFNDNGVMKHNDWTIGIETCHTDWDGKYDSSTYTTFVRLTADLLGEYGLSVETGLLRHYDMTGKDCPQLFDGEENLEWEKFKSDVRLAMGR